MTAIPKVVPRSVIITIINKKAAAEPKFRAALSRLRKIDAIHIYARGRPAVN